MPVTALALAKKKAAAKKKKPAAKKPAAKKAAAKPEPTDAMIDAVIDLVDDANDLICDLDDAAAADTVDEYTDAVAQASKKLARVMAGMHKLALRLDPAAYAAAQAKARALPAMKAPALAQ